jgi:hypothetical protein
LGATDELDDETLRAAGIETQDDLKDSGNLAGESHIPAEL